MSNCQRLNIADPFYPSTKDRDVGVNAGIIRITASVSPGYNSVEGVIRGEGSARITLARVLAALIQITRADHSVGDIADELVFESTSSSVHDRQRHPPQHV